MKRILELVLCLAMLAGVADAGGEPAEEYAEPERCVDYYNTHVEKVPKFLNPIIGDQTINVHIVKDNETVFVHGVRTEGVSVAEFYNMPFSDPDMDVYIKQSLIDRVLTEDRSAIKKRVKQELAAEDSGLAAFHAAYNETCDSGELECVPRRMRTKIRMFVLKLFALESGSYLLYAAAQSICCKPVLWGRVVIPEICGFAECV
jgi:hypothetical protein